MGAEIQALPLRTRNHFSLKTIIESHLSLSSWEPTANIGLGIRQRTFTFLPILHSQFLSLIPSSVNDHLEGHVLPLYLHWLELLQILAGSSLPSSPYPFVSASNTKRYSQSGKPMTTPVQELGRQLHVPSFSLFSITQSNFQSFSSSLVGTHP